MCRITVVLAILAFGIATAPQSLTGSGIYGSEWGQIDLNCPSGPTQTTPWAETVPGCTVNYELLTGGSD